MTERHGEIIWLTVPEASDYLKVSKTTLYNLMKDGRLPFYYIAGTRQRRLNQADVNKILVPGDPSDLDASEDEPES